MDHAHPGKNGVLCRRCKKRTLLPLSARLTPCSCFWCQQGLKEKKFIHTIHSRHRLYLLSQYRESIKAAGQGKRKEKHATCRTFA